MGIHSLSDMREGSIDSPWISVNEQTSTHYHAFIQSWHDQSPCSRVFMWSLRLTSQSSSPSPSSGSDSENTSYAWFEWDAIIDLDCKFANMSNLQTCKLSCCLSASQSSNRAAKWLHVDIPTERKWKRYSIALCFFLFSFYLSILNLSFCEYSCW